MNEANPIKNLVNYFKRNLAKGYTIDSLKWALINQGYPKSVLDRAVRQLNKELSERAPELKEKPKIKYEVLDEDNNPITIKRSLVKELFYFCKSNLFFKSFKKNTY